MAVAGRRHTEHLHVAGHEPQSDSQEVITVILGGQVLPSPPHYGGGTQGSARSRSLAAATGWDGEAGIKAWVSGSHPARGQSHQGNSSMGRILSGKKQAAP